MQHIYNEVWLDGFAFTTYGYCLYFEIHPSFSNQVPKQNARLNRSFALMLSF